MMKLQLDGMSPSSMEKLSGFLASDNNTVHYQQIPDQTDPKCIETENGTADQIQIAVISASQPTSPEVWTVLLEIADNVVYRDRNGVRKYIPIGPIFALVILRTIHTASAQATQT